MNKQTYLNFTDIFVVPCINGDILQYKSQNILRELLEDCLFDDFIDECPKNEDYDDAFYNWIQENSYKVYEYFENVLENDDAE